MDRRLFGIGLLAAAIGWLIVQALPGCGDDRRDPGAPASTVSPLRKAEAPRPAAPSRRHVVRDDPAATPTAPAAAFHPRDPEEWQGMRVHLADRATCASTERCGLAMACQGGLCGACTVDGDCAAGEACVLDHCLRREAVACRSRRDCGGAARCVLSGYSDDPRGNGEMRAACLEPQGGTEQPADAPAPEPGAPAPPLPVRPDRLLETL